MQPRTPTNPIQGDGDYAAATRFNTAERAFIESGKVAKSAGRAAPKSQQVARELLRAEANGKGRAKGQGSLISDKRKSRE